LAAIYFPLYLKPPRFTVNAVLSFADTLFSLREDAPANQGMPDTALGCSYIFMTHVLRRFGFGKKPMRAVSWNKKSSSFRGVGNAACVETLSR
jgi:hypothetical protein